jgi:hypothetical protein
VAEDDRGEENAEGEGEGFILRSVQTTPRVVAGCEGVITCLADTNKSQGLVLSAPAQDRR